MSSCSEINHVIMRILVSSSYLPAEVTSPSVLTAEALITLDVRGTICVSVILVRLYLDRPRAVYHYWIHNKLMTSQDP